MSRVPHTPLSAEQQVRWQEENEDTVASINAFIERYGLLSERLRYRPELATGGTDPLSMKETPPSF